MIRAGARSAGGMRCWLSWLMYWRDSTLVACPRNHRDLQFEVAVSSDLVAFWAA